MIDAWLTETLFSLNLHMDFQKKIHLSAREGATRAQKIAAAANFKHIHLKVYIPKTIAANRHTWGFFRTEKIEKTAASGIPDHTIEFYLYME